MTMMHEQLDAFTAFAKHAIAQDESLSLDELWDRWRLENPLPAEAAKDELAVKAALRDMELGDNGIPAEEHLRDVREQYGLGRKP